jgi:LysM repeat protein
MKKPKFLSQLSAVLTPRPKKVLKASARVARPAMDDYDSDEPQTKLSSAFIVVLILHVVAVGGIYAFNSIKASRRDREVSTSSVDAPAPEVAQSTAANAAAAAAAAASSPARTAEPPAPVPTLANTRAPGTRQYQVQSGDNLTKIAFAFKVTTADIMAANQLKDGATLIPGRTLTIPAPRTATKPVAEAAKTTPAVKVSDVAPTKTTPGFYTVKKGDTLTSIARSFGISMQELSKANKITDPKKLQLGQVLKVPPRKS